MMQLFNNMDWDLLRKQKAIISNMGDVTNPEQSEAIEGILALIDAVQDGAVDELGIDAEVVFPGVGKDDADDVDEDTALPKQDLLAFLEREFPWLGTDEPANGADVVDQLNELRESLREELGVVDEDSEDDDDDNMNICVCSGENCQTMVERGEEYFATPCGTFCNSCMITDHAKGCEICASEFEIDTDEDVDGTDNENDDAGEETDDRTRTDDDIRHEMSQAQRLRQ